MALPDIYRSPADSADSVGTRPGPLRPGYTAGSSTILRSDACFARVLIASRGLIACATSKRQENQGKVNSVMVNPHIIRQIVDDPGDSLDTTADDLVCFEREKKRDVIVQALNNRDRLRNKLLGHRLACSGSYKEQTSFLEGSPSKTPLGRLLSCAVPYQFPLHVFWNVAAARSTCSPRPQINRAIRQDEHEK